MSMTLPVEVHRGAAKNGFSVPVLLLCWLLAGLSLGFKVGYPTVQRTQEARVLETARQMRGSGWRGWLVPKINGNLRLQKPPLAYWMAAVSYDIAGVSSTSGRLPTVLCGWLALAVTFGISRRLFGSRAAFLGSACLLCSFLFFRHDRLAETDAPSALFVTIAIGAWLKALDADLAPSEASSNRGAQLGWFHLGALATSLAVLFKGGPGAFPPIFLLAMVLLRRQWRAIWRFVISGAPIVLIVLSFSWFAYALHSTRSGQINGEVDTLLSGQDHFAPFWHYTPELIKATLPWTLVALAAVILAVEPLFSKEGGSFSVRWRQWALLPQAAVVVWALSIFVPLCAIGNKQFHYLLPLMPPVMILVGWLLDLATSEASKALPKWIGAVIDGTLFGTILVVPGVLVATHKVLGQDRPIDYALAAGILVAVILVVGVYMSRGRFAAVLTYLLCCAVIFPVTIGMWMPDLEPDDSRLIARQIAADYGAGPYVFFGPNYSLPLCFNLRSAIPSIKKEAELEELTRKDPNLVIIAQSKSKYPAPALPPEFVPETRVITQSQSFQIYRLRRGAIH